MTPRHPNLIPAHRVEARRFRRRLRTWTVVCVLYAAGAVAVYAACQAGGPDQAAGADPKVQADQVARQCDVETAAIVALRKQLASAHRRLEFNKAISAQPDWSILLAVLSTELGDHAFLRSCVLTPQDDAKKADAADRPHRTAAQRDYVLELKGYGRDHATVSQFVLRIEKLRVFSEVRVVRTFREPVLSGDGVAFHLKCLLTREDAPTR